jgi:CubicO group peptidase (beta-lactamase class C family)
VKVEHRPLDDAVRRAGIPGLVAAAADPNALIDAFCCGDEDRNTGAPMGLDTVFWIASITKVVTAVAVLQLVERGKLSLNEPVARFLPYLGRARVLSPAGELIEPARQITVHDLLTHTAGFGYEGWSRELRDHVLRHSLPAASTGTLASLERPLLFHPGERWNYGIGMDWAGLLVEKITGMPLAAYFRSCIFEPLGMRCTGFAPVAAGSSGRAQLHTRTADGSFRETPNGPNPQREFDSGGAGLYSTPRDVLLLLQSLLRAAQGKPGEVLSPETAAEARRNQIGALDVRDLPSCVPERSMDLALCPGQQKKWSYLGLLHIAPQPGGRSVQSVSWAGIANTYFWIDFEASVAAVVFAQTLPFLDPQVVALVETYERSLYATTLAGIPR